jgi:protein-tyrosine phosphatase
MDEVSQIAPALAAPGDDVLAEATPARVIPLKGGVNFRDLGGYRTGAGRRVRTGRLYRSGTLSALTLEDRAFLEGLGLKTVCDLRTNSERTSEPNRWVAETAVAYWSRDYDLSFGELRRIMGEGPLDAQQARAAMQAAYAHLPYEQAPAYRELFHRLAAGETPMIFHCSAGKDRAGTAAALILSALGVPRETVVADYLLSDQLARARHEARERAGGGANPVARHAPEVIRAIFAADASYLASAFDALEARHGSVEGYLADELSVTAPMLREIRNLLLD